MIPLALLALTIAQANPERLAEIYGAGDDIDRLQTLSSIVFVPGILGSQIVDPADDRLYWGEVFGQAARPNQPGPDFVKMALPLATGAAAVAGIDDDLDAGDMLFAVQVDTPFGELQARGYPGVFEGLVQTLVGGASAHRVRLADARDGMIPFEAFGYDWRRDIADEARRLHATVLEAAERRRAAGGPARVTLIGHSMGALLVRYYLMYGDAALPDTGRLPAPTWAGAARVSDALLVAPPNAGSPLVFEALHTGEKVNALLPKYPPALIGTWPSMYQMMPRTRHGHVLDETGAPVDLYDVVTWATHGLGMFAADQAGLVDLLLAEVPAEERPERLRAHVAACLARAARLQAAMDQPAAPPPHLRLHLFAGDMLDTPTELTLDRATHTLRWTGREPGDGRVSRRSALLDERALGVGGRLRSPIAWTTAWFGPVEHFTISRDSGFLDNALYVLLEHPW